MKHPLDYNTRVRCGKSSTGSTREFYRITSGNGGSQSYYTYKVEFDDGFTSSVDEQWIALENPVPEPDAG